MSEGEVNYYTENSDVTLLTSPTQTQAPGTSWRPGLAGLTERVAMGSGDGNGWFVYFFERWLVIECWVDGQWEFTRRLDCTPLQDVQGSKHRHLIGMGYDLQNNMISLGCVSRDADNPDDARVVHGDFYVPNLNRVFAHPPVVHMGTVPVAVPGGTQTRTINAKISTVGGRVSSKYYLSKGELARLSAREVKYAD